MDSHNILPLLGLALRGGNLAVGEEPVEAAARAKDARVLLLASDAAENTRRRVEHFAEAGQCLWLRLPFPKAELGRALGRTAVAVAAVTDTGLANALTKKLAALDPELYGEAAQRMERKAQRAAQRRAEQRAHTKNLRSGTRKPKKSPPGPAAKDPPSLSRPPAARPRTAQGPGGPRPNKGPGASRLRSPGGSRSRGPGGGRPNPYAHSRPVKKGKGSFRRREDT